MKHEYLDYVQDILDSMNDIETFIAGISFEKFLDDKKTINAVIRSLEVIGEAAKNIPENIKNKHPEVPWKKMAGMRDKLIHEYSGIDESIVWKVAKDELPPIKSFIEKILVEG